MEPHPVRAFGNVMGQVEARLYPADAHHRRAAGVAHATIGLLIGTASGTLLRSTALATYLSVAPRGLMTAALDVGAALDAGDLVRARELLPTLVGRDPSELDEGEIARAVVESVAENTVDALVAPVVWAVMGGAGGALAYRAVNTMDASVGHRNERYGDYGWASARLDDAANLLPARLTALLVVAVRPRAARSVWVAVRRQAPAHPSPNAGVAEAAFAAALGLRLGGVNTYGAQVERRATLGSGRPAVPADIGAAVDLCRDVTWALAASLGTAGLGTA
jgi:adenosylcobinamide-phosphate synthase